MAHARGHITYACNGWKWILRFARVARPRVRCTTRPVACPDTRVSTDHAGGARRAEPEAATVEK